MSTKDCTDDEKRSVIKPCVQKSNLPDGWIGLAHSSGGIVYMHRKTRVVTWSRPYQLSKTSSLRKHGVPLISIPCFHQKRMLSKVSNKRTLGCADGPVKAKKQCCHGNDVEESDMMEIISVKNKTEVNIDNKNMKCNNQCDSSKLNTLNERGLSTNIDAVETVDPNVFHDYLAKIFEFEEVPKDRLSTPLYTDSGFDTILEIAERPAKRKQIEVGGKSPVQRLHEYCQQKLKSTLVFEKLNLPLERYFYVQANCDGLYYGTGRGETLKAAKSHASQLTLSILEPCFKKGEEEDYLKIFDTLLIEDKEIISHMKKLSCSLPYPYDIMRHLLKRHFSSSNFRSKDIQVDRCCVEGKYNCTITCRHLTATAASSDKHCSREFASQAFIKQLYPTLEFWGSAIRLHESTQQALAEKKKSAKDTGHYGNRDIQAKLRKEMKSLLNQTDI